MQELCQPVQRTPITAHSTHLLTIYRTSNSRRKEDRIVNFELIIILASLM